MSSKRLISIDMLRGVASLAVVLFHAAFTARLVGMTHWPYGLKRALAIVLSYGGLGVVLFFIISGFCIHLRRASAVADGLSPDIDFVDFWKRRVRRLYPTYLVALTIYVIAQVLSGTFHATWFRAYDLATHLTMVHNFDARTAFSIEPVFWTLAIEEQLYLAYFLLLVLRDRLGWGWTLALCLAARVFWFGVVYTVLRTLGFELSYYAGSLSYWFTWALGAVCVEATLGVVKLPRWTGRSSTGLALFAVAVACDYVHRARLGGGITWRLAWLATDPLWGVAFFVLVNRVVAAERGWRESGRLPALAAILAKLGLFSYSTYLMHDFVLERIAPPLLRGLGLAVDPWNKLMLTPLCLGLCWLFFLPFERPFLSPKKRPAARVLVAPEVPA